MHPETIAVHAGRMIDPTTGAISPPLHLSTTFERDADGQFSRGYAYVRDDNPNRRALETCLASLEGGVAAVAFPSGMAAISAALEALAFKHPGSILLPQDMYFGIRSLLLPECKIRQLLCGCTPPLASWRYDCCCPNPRTARNAGGYDIAGYTNV